LRLRELDEQASPKKKESSGEGEIAKVILLPTAREVRGLETSQANPSLEKPTPTRHQRKKEETRGLPEKEKEKRSSETIIQKELTRKQ